MDDIHNWMCDEVAQLDLKDSDLLKSWIYHVPANQCGNHSKTQCTVLGCTTCWESRNQSSKNMINVFFFTKTHLNPSTWEMTSIGRFEPHLFGGHSVRKTMNLR